MVDKIKHIEQVNFYQLKKNYKYIVTDLYGVFHYVGTFDHYRHSANDMVIFKNVVCINPIERPCGYVNFSYSISRKFYTLVSKKKEIQQSMETRALNKIIQNIIGDELFEWV
jgi:hypothetical protein